MKQLTFLFLFFISINVVAQETDSKSEKLDSVKTLSAKPSFFKSFADQEILDIVFSTDLKAMYGRKKNGIEYQEADFTYKNASGEELHFKIEARLRGNSRRKICFYKPLKLKFKKKDLESMGYTKKFNDFKLVPHCKSGKFGDQNLVKEYLMYKMYEALTNKGFGTQIARITYKDAKGKKKPVTHMAFLIEEMNELTARLEGEDCDCKLRNPAILDQDQYSLMAVFQFMIGNTDWWFKNQHNLKIVRPFNGERPFIVPYDFDYSGLVGTSYSVPNDRLPIKTVQQRYFMGHSKKESSYTEVIKLFVEKKEELYAIINDCPYLNKKERPVMLRYMDEFYSVLDNPKLIRARFFLD